MKEQNESRQPCICSSWLAAHSSQQLFQQNVIKVPHRYAVQGSDTTMFNAAPFARTIKPVYTIIKTTYTNSVTCCISVGSKLALRIAMPLAALPANTLNASLVISSSLIIMGTPLSPPSRMVCTIGICPRKGMSNSSAKFLPPSLPKMKYLFSGSSAGVITHVLHQANDGHFQLRLPKHSDAFFSIGQRNQLRSGNHYYAGYGYGLHDG